jgi:opacity protein-like surface antigen
MVTVTVTAQTIYDADRGYYAQNGGGYYYSGGNSAQTYQPGDYPPPNTPPPGGPATDEYFVVEGAGPYFRAEIGPSFFGNTHLKHFGVPANDKVVFDTGLAVNAAVGYAFNRNLSADFETGFIGADVDHINFFTFDRARYFDIPFMANVMVSFPSETARVVPYFGAGAGGAVAVFDCRNLTTPANPTISGRESTGVFAGQVFAGVRVKLNHRMWIGGGYKFFKTSDPTWNYPNGFKFGMKNVDTHSLQFSFLWKF